MKFMMFPEGHEIKDKYTIEGKEYLHIETNVTKLAQFSNIGDGYLLEWNDDGGLMLYVLMDNPSPLEIDNVISTNKSFEIRFAEIMDCGCIAIKFGALPWGDCTFEPRIVDEMTFPNCEENETQGLALNIIMVDTSKGGLVVGIRILGMGNHFSQKFSKWCVEKRENKSPEFTKQYHYNQVDKVRSRYSILDIAKYAQFRWKL